MIWQKIYKGVNLLSQPAGKDNRTNKAYLWILIGIIAFVGLWFFALNKDGSKNPNTLLEAYIEDETAGEFAHLYDYLPAETREQFLRDDFAKKYEAAYSFIYDDQVSITFDPLDEQSLKFAEKDGKVMIPTNFTYDLSNNRTLSLDYETPLVTDPENNNEWSIDFNGDLYGTPIFLHHMLEQILNSIHEPLQNEKDPTENERINFLLIEKDDKTGANGPESKFNVITLDQQDMSVKVTMVPRDMRAYLPGIDQEDKVFHSLAHGGIDLAVSTVEEAFDMPIHYYMILNHSGLGSLLDFVDGITVDNDETFVADGLEFPEGSLELNRDEAFIFMGYEPYLKGDINFEQYTKRHRAILHGLWDVIGHNDVEDMGILLELFQEHVTTNFDVDLFTKLFLEAKHLDYVELRGESTTIDGVYYYHVSDELLKKAREQMVE